MAGEPPAPGESLVVDTLEPRSPASRIPVVELATLLDLDTLIDRIADRRVIFIGESHDRYEDHLTQLAVIQGLHARGRPLAIGMEFFQQPFQEVLDAYVAGEIDEAELLRRSEYFERWRYDYRLYRPILTFAREQGVPIIALNLESELTRRVGEVGIDGLDDEQRARVPDDLDGGDAAYRERLKAIFAQHPNERGQDVEHFIEVQLLWDEGMAHRAASYLSDESERTLVVLAGSGHVEYGVGIPSRLQRRLDVPVATILNGNQRSMHPAAADFFVYPQRVDLPEPGRLGVMLESGIGEEGARILGFAEGSSAQEGGLKAGDRIVQIGEQPIATYADVRIALVDGLPGERVPVSVLRKRTLGGDERLAFEVELR
ncbi:iron-regulated protein [Thiocapsa imhoffii]|uniref:Iron-regulated protein n=2 Tax=Thiocapsa imhoffii TaxID=382777 RepID=A0A9X0WGZ4_9GAMM|nr:ChaN family lipoprotein [Thiocapsa imhoffii]MBK1644109.1 iron-regulated protein [Thiocapsa imhoffii]